MHTVPYTRDDLVQNVSMADGEKLWLVPKSGYSKQIDWSIWENTARNLSHGECVRDSPGLPLNQLEYPNKIKDLESAGGEKSETYVLQSFADLGFWRSRLDHWGMAKNTKELHSEGRWSLLLFPGTKKGRLTRAIEVAE